MDVPVPEACPVCVVKELLTFWVFGRFRKTTSALSGKSIITVRPASMAPPLYAYDEWISDAWDPLSYARDYDPTRPFFEQFVDLQNKVPHPHLLGNKNVDCDWCDDVWTSKNCYLCRSLVDCENVSYGYRVIRCRDSFDITFSFDLQMSYDCLYCYSLYRVRHAFDSRDSTDSIFLYDCRNVQNCFMCWNLRNKRYCILNEQYSKEEYQKKLKEFDIASYSGVEKLKKQFQELISREAVHRENFNIKTVNSSGNYIDECKNCASCYFLQESENCRHIFRGYQDKETVLSVGALRQNLTAMCGQNTDLYDVVGALDSMNCRYSAYLKSCEDCEYCFGCVGMRKKKYCILNKQYSKELFGELKTRIIEQMKKDKEWGKFFPLAVANCAYNDSLAQLFFPRTAQEVAAAGGRWDEPEDIAHEGMSGDQVPELVSAVRDDFWKQAIICPATKRRFNVSPRELQFLRQFNIPLPRYHPDYRTVTRYTPLTAITSFSGTCYFCKNDITHYYPPEWKYAKIACTDCYQQQIS